jgi:acyl carrier protein
MACTHGMQIKGSRMKQSRQEILDYVLQSLSELSQDWDYSEPVGPETLLFSQMGLDSLDLVVLGTGMQEHYGQQMPFAEFLAAIGERGQRDVSVSELVDFIDAQMSPPSPAAAPEAEAKR